jgi:hypothetical protein
MYEDLFPQGALHTFGAPPIFYVRIDKMRLMEPFVGREEYDPSLMLYLRNPKQSYVFAKHIKMYDVILSTDGFAYVFLRADVDAHKLLEKWRNFELS